MKSKTRKTKTRPTDTEIVDYIASLWDSEGKGGKLLWKWIPNTTGSFRDAMASAMTPNNDSATGKS